MNWTTLYVKGKSDFRGEVRKKLENADINVMPGNIEDSLRKEAHDLYWIDERLDVRTVKEAVGSKLVWKYRLEFFTSLEAFIESEEKSKPKDEFTPEEMDMIKTMRRKTRKPKQAQAA